MTESAPGPDYWQSASRAAQGANILTMRQESRPEEMDSHTWEAGRNGAKIILAALTEMGIMVDPKMLANAVSAVMIRHVPDWENRVAT